MPRHRLVKLRSSLPPFRGVLEEFYHYTQSRRMPRSIAARRLVDFYFRHDRPFEISVLGSRGLPSATSVAVRRGPAHFGKASPGHAGRFLHARARRCSCTQRTVLRWNSPFMDPGMVSTALPD
jgi:hypothetical protein